MKELRERKAEVDGDRGAKGVGVGEGRAMVLV